MNPPVLNITRQLPVRFPHVCALAVLCASCAGQQYSPPKTVVVQSPNQPTVAQQYDYTQRAQTNTMLVSGDDALKFIKKFNEIYTEKGKPVATYALKINPDSAGNSSPPASLNEQQTVADIGRYIGRPLREGGVKLVDESIARGANPGFHPDIVIRVLATSRSISMQDFSGQTVTRIVPDLQIEAVRTQDGQVLGQAGSDDLIGAGQDAWVVVDRVGFPEVYKATALVLLEDMVRRKFDERVARVEGKIRQINEVAKEIAENKPAKVPPPAVPSTPSQSDPEKPKSPELVSLTPTNLPRELKRDLSDKTPPIQAPKTPQQVHAGPIWPPILELPPAVQFNITNVALINDFSTREQLKEINDEVTEVNEQQKQILAWKYGLLTDEQYKRLKDKSPQFLVKNTLKEKLEKR